MNRSEAVKAIVNPIVEFATTFTSGKSGLGVEFEKMYGDMGGDKSKGFARRICGELMAVLYVSSSYSLTTMDDGNLRYNKLSDNINVAMAGALSSILLPQINHPTYEEASRIFLSTIQTYAEYLNGVSLAGLDNFLSIIKTAGISSSTDIRKQKALAFRLWTLVCLERVLLGDNFRPEKQGALCFMLISEVNRMADDFEKVFTEYCGPSPVLVPDVKKGCLLPFALFWFVFCASVVAGYKLFA